MQSSVAFLQIVVFDAAGTNGHVELLPVQNESAWQTSDVPLLHTVVFGKNSLAGHCGEVPLQNASKSHSPVELAQSVVFGSSSFGGQAASTPLQNASNSHEPVALEHIVWLVKKPLGSIGQMSVPPMQIWSPMHGPVKLPQYIEQVDSKDSPM
jgi:hypothetical protein